MSLSSSSSPFLCALCNLINVTADLSTSKCNLMDGLNMLTVVIVIIIIASPSSSTLLSAYIVTLVMHLG